MSRIPRHLFLPESQRENAYGRRPVPIGWEQTISTSFIVASMTEALELTGCERVLEIGTGCGYQTAVLCETAGSVHSIEIIPSLAKQAAQTLASLGYHPELRINDGAMGWPEEAPFDRIIWAATTPYIPEAWLAQCTPDALLIGPQEERENEVLVRLRGTPSGFVRDLLYGVRFVPMTGAVRG
jgi:protein-L-isoaspartate(D-aspartate) O-methyltransferase